MGKRLRRPGSPWRLLVHHYTGQQPDGTSYDISHHVANTPRRSPDGQHSRSHILEDTEFDELVVGHWDPHRADGRGLLVDEHCRNHDRCPRGS
jgi:hypothetical protein